MIEDLKKYWLVAAVIAASPTIYFIVKLFLDYHKIKEIFQKNAKSKQKVRLHYHGVRWETGLLGPKKSRKALTEAHIKLYNPEKVVLRVRIVQFDVKFKGAHAGMRPGSEVEFPLSANSTTGNIHSAPIVYPKDSPMLPVGHIDVVIQYGRDMGEDTVFGHTLRVAGTLDIRETRYGPEARFHPYPDIEPPTYPDPETIVLDGDRIEAI